MIGKKPNFFEPQFPRVQIEETNNDIYHITYCIESQTFSIWCSVRHLDDIQ